MLRDVDARAERDVAAAATSWLVLRLVVRLLRLLRLLAWWMESLVSLSRAIRQGKAAIASGGLKHSRGRVVRQLAREVLRLAVVASCRWAHGLGWVLLHVLVVLLLVRQMLLLLEKLLLLW